MRCVVILDISKFGKFLDKFLRGNIKIRLDNIYFIKE